MALLAARRRVYAVLFVFTGYGWERLWQAVGGLVAGVFLIAIFMPALEE